MTLRILDLTCDVAGRFGTRLFADAGAAVLRCAPALPEPRSLGEYLDHGKQIVGAEDVARLARECDLVWTSFDAGRYLGLAKDISVPAGAVHVTTSSYGTTGPYAAWRGGSLADWAAGGYLYITGDPDREPLSGPENLCAYAAGFTAAAAAEAALVDRMRTGRGRHVDVSTMEAMLLLHQSTFSRAGSGELRRRTGRYTEVYPLTVLPCRDGHVSLGVVTDVEFDKLAIAVGRPELPVDPRFVDIGARWSNRDAFDAELAPFLEAHDAEEIVALFQAGGVACAKVAGPIEVTQNPQLAHRRFWQAAPGGGLMPGYPLRTFHPFSAGRAAAPLGETGELPLAGVRVLDFTAFWAGPSAARLLADLGADVIWIERPGSRLDTDLAAGAEASPAQVQQHLYATKMYRGKRSIMLNLERPEHRDVAHALVREAHVVIENFRPGVADKLGIGPAELAQCNPGLVYVSLSGWGADGPWAGWRSYGPSIEAASSIAGRTGYRGGEPLRLGHTLPDGVGGLLGGLAALRGLRGVIESGKGGWFDVAQLEGYVALSGEGIIEATRGGAGLERVGNRSRFGAVQGVFRCCGEDQWIAVRLEDEADRARFAEFAGLDAALFGDADALEAAISRFTAPQDKAELAAQLQAADIEAFPVLDAYELIDDPHLKARGYFVSVTAGDHVHAMPGTPFVATPAMARVSPVAPKPNEHADAVFAMAAADRRQ